MPHDDIAKDKKSEIVIGLYQGRFKQLRLGHEFYKKGNLAKATEHYSNYLSILAQFFNTEESNLNPQLFEKKKDIGELLLISNVYWSLAKTYDKSPKFQHHSARCLKQFLKFTLGYKHQYANARILKNYINSGKPKNKKEFRQIYEKLRINSPPCFIASYCFGRDALVTRQLHSFREDISGTFLGDAGTRLYYKYAPTLVDFFDRHTKIKKIALPPIKATLVLIAHLHQKLK